MNTAELMERVAQVAPAKYDFIVKTAEEVSQSPFRDEIIDQLDAIVKTANPTRLERFGNAAAGVGAMAATGIAYSLAGDMYDAVRRGISKSRNYRTMLRENPDLKQLPATNVQKAFSTLHRFNPEFASDPTVAGSFVRRQAQYPEFDPNQLANLIGARKNLTDIRKLPIPGKLPWESHDEKSLRSAQTKHFQMSGAKAEKELGFMGEEHARRGQEHTMRVEQHKRQGEIHPLQIQQLQQLHAQGGEKHPLEMQRIKQQLEHGPTEHAMKLQEHGWKGQKELRDQDKEERDVALHAEQLSQMVRQGPLTNLNTAKAMQSLSTEIPDPNDPTKTIRVPLSQHDVESLITRARQFR